MPIAPVIIALLVADVAVLIWAELRDDRKRIYLFKPIATLLVITLAAFAFKQEGVSELYANLILVGLYFSFGGDIALMWPKNPKAFRLGLASFLLAHIVYTIAFFKIGTATSSDIAPIILLLLVSFAFFWIIRAGLEKMRGPVIAYILIITTMVAGAIIVQGSQGVPTLPGTLVLIGALLFYVSDLILAANRFWRPWQYNRISLGFYYSGQLLIALSAHHMIV